MPNGGIIGPINTPSIFRAPGVWTLSEAQAAAGAKIWPGSGDLDLSFTAHGTDSTNATAHTVSALPIGAAHDYRYILAVTGHNSPGAVNGVTLDSGGGDVAMTLLFTAGPNSNRYVKFWLLQVPTGTTATVKDSLASAGNRFTVDLYRIVGLLSETVRASASGTSDPQTLDVATLIQSAVIAGAFSASGAATFSWTGLTENSDDGAHMSSASHLATTAESPRAVSVDFTGTVSAQVAGCIVLR